MDDTPNLDLLERMKKAEDWNPEAATAASRSTVAKAVRGIAGQAVSLSDVVDPSILHLSRGGELTSS